MEKRSKPQYSLLIKCHQDILLQRPTKNHSWEGGTERWWVQSRLIWVSSGSQEQFTPIPAVPHPSACSVLYGGTTRHPRCRSQLWGALRTEKHVKKQILILTGGVQLRTAQNKTAPEGRGTWMALAAPVSVLLLSEKNWLPIRMPYKVFKC